MRVERLSVMQHLWIKVNGWSAREGGMLDNTAATIREQENQPLNTTLIYIYPIQGCTDTHSPAVLTQDTVGQAAAAALSSGRAGICESPIHDWKPHPRPNSPKFADTGASGSLPCPSPFLQYPHLSCPMWDSLSPINPWRRMQRSFRLPSRVTGSLTWALLREAKRLLLLPLCQWVCQMRAGECCSCSSSCAVWLQNTASLLHNHWAALSLWSWTGPGDVPCADTGKGLSRLILFFYYYFN